MPEQKVRLLHPLVQEELANQLRLHRRPSEVRWELILGQPLEQLKLAGGRKSDSIFLETPTWSTVGMNTRNRPAIVT